MVFPSLTDFVTAADRMAPALFDTAARSVLIVGFAGLAALAMRRASAAARHWVWMLGFAGLLLLPLLSATLPGWRVLPRWEARLTALPPTGFEIVAAPSFPEPAEHIGTVAPAAQALSDVRTDPPAAGQQDTVRAQPVVSPQPAAQQLAAPILKVDQVKAVQSSQPVPLQWTTWALLVWLIGALLLLAHMMLGYLSLWVLQRRCARICRGELPELLSQLRQALHVGRPVELLTSPQRTMPMTWGLWRTRLLLPQHAVQWSPEQRRAVLLHELSHVRRWDCLTQFLAQIACALYWFNPLVWVGWRRMQIERERACDDMVLNTGAKATAYAHHLLDSASALSLVRFASAAVGMARPSTLEERLRAILDSHRNRRALTARSALATMLLLLAGLLPVAALRAQDQPSPPAPATPPAVAPTPAPAPVNPDASIEDRLRVRRAQDPGSPAAPTSRPANPAPPGRGSRGGFAAPGGAPGGARGGFGGGIAAPTLIPQAAVLGQGPTCTLDAIIYEVRLPGNMIGRLDADALARSSTTPESFEKALADLGTTLPLYRANQTVRLASDSITIGTTVPYVSSSQKTAQGDQINTVQYSSVGALFDMAGKATGPGSIDLDMSIQVSALSEGTAHVSSTVTAPLFRRVTMSHKGMVQPGKPFVVMSVDAAAPDPQGKAVAYVARINLGTPQFATAPAPGR